MSEWKKVKLGDLFSIKHGYAFSGEHIIEEDNNVVLVTPGNFRIGGGFQERKCKFYDGEIPKDYILKEGDFIVTMTDLSKTIDTLGYSALVPKSDKRIYLHNQRIGLVHFKNDECDCEYIYWVMRTYDYQRAIANTSTGSTVHHTSPSKICDYECVVPDKAKQHRIATILSRYDTLIENCQKQIKLLEEAAQRFYKEWFVNLRFPGYENAKMVDDLPEGWEKKKMADICDTIGGGTPSTKNASYYESGTINWVTPTDITRNNSLCLLDTEKKITREGLNHSSAKMLPPETILMTSRASVGFFGICDFEVCTNQGFISCVPIEKDFQMYLLYNLMNRVEEIRRKAGGSTYLEISKSVFRNFDIICPDNHIVSLFQKEAHRILENIRSISRQIRLLTEARDRLLPKVMGGEMEVGN